MNKLTLILLSLMITQPMLVEAGNHHFKVKSFNMQGATFKTKPSITDTKKTGSTWITGVRDKIERDQPDIFLLQEAGEFPDSEHLQNHSFNYKRYTDDLLAGDTGPEASFSYYKGDYVKDSNGAIVSSNLQEKTAVLRKEVWSIGGTDYYIYHLAVDEGNNSAKNLAIISKREAYRVHIIPPLTQELSFAQVDGTTKFALGSRPSLAIEVVSPRYPATQYEQITTFVNVHLKSGIGAGNEARTMANLIQDLYDPARSFSPGNIEIYTHPSNTSRFYTFSGDALAYEGANEFLNQRQAGSSVMVFGDQNVNTKGYEYQEIRTRLGLESDEFDFIGNPTTTQKGSAEDARGSTLDHGYATANYADPTDAAAARVERNSRSDHEMIDISSDNTECYFEARFDEFGPCPKRQKRGHCLPPPNL